METLDQILLILDIDETLLHASEKRLDRAPDFVIGPYYIYQRPFLKEFLLSCKQLFSIAVWSSSGADYLESVIHNIFPSEVIPEFVWNRKHCIQRYDPEYLEIYFVKDLKKVKQKGYNLNRILIVDDTPKKVERNYGNAIYVRPYLGDENDEELKNLAGYLKSFQVTPNVRTVEKRGWRYQKRED